MIFNEVRHEYTRGVLSYGYPWKLSRINFENKLKDKGSNLYGYSRVGLKGEYLRLLDEKGIGYESVTTFIGRYKKPVDWDSIAKKVGEKRGVSSSVIKGEWEQAGIKGTAHHLKMEEYVYEHGMNYLGDKIGEVVRYGINSDGDKVDDNIYLDCGKLYCEKVLWIDELRLCGTSDLVYVDDNGFVHIDDYKTNKVISEMSWERSIGKSGKMMLGPISHLEECDLVKFGLQLSIYMRMILLHNPELKFGSLRILHELFSDGGEYLGSKEYMLPYYEREVDLMFRDREGSILFNYF